MADNEKAKLYQEIVQKADERTVLERMRLHGFWPADRGLPVDPPQMVHGTRLRTDSARLVEHLSGHPRDPQQSLRVQGESGSRHGVGDRRGGRIAHAATRLP